MSRELLKRAAVVLREVWDNDDCYCAPSVIKLQKEIETYLAQPEPEPVASINGWYGGYPTICIINGAVLPAGTPLYTTPPDQSARVAELEKDNNIAHGNLAWYMEKYHEHLTIIEVSRDLLIRYRNETPIEHQPHMIAHEVDNALAAHGIGVNHE